MSGSASLVCSCRRATGAEGYARGRSASIRGGRNHPQVLLAKIICSDPECTEEVEIAVEMLDELDGLSCECGYGFVLQNVSERAEPADVVEIATLRGAARPGSARRAA